MDSDEASEGPVRCDICRGTEPDSGNVATLRVRFLERDWSTCSDCIPALETSHDFKLLSRIPDIPCASCDESGIYIIEENGDEIAVCQDCLRERRKDGLNNVTIVDHPLSGATEESDHII